MKRLPILLSTAGCLALLLVALSLVSHRHVFFEADLELTRWLQGLELPGLGALMLGISWLGYAWKPWALAGVTAIALLWRGRKRDAGLFTAALSLGAGTNRLLKFIVARPRPDDLISVARLHTSESFPSGHVVFYVLYFGFLLYLVRRRVEPGLRRGALELALGLPILLVGPSRVWMGAHWTSDVIGGYLLGSAALLLLIAVYENASGDPEEERRP